MQSSDPRTERRFFPSQVVENNEVAPNYSLLRVDGCLSLGDARPGQFAMLRGEWGRDPILPRAYSILSVDGDEARFLVRHVGRGSRLLGQAQPGARLTVLGPLGNSFPPPAANVHDLLVAGGCGLPPLHMAALEAKRAGAEVLLGARCAEELIGVLLDQVRGRDVPLHLITEDGSSGRRGLVTELLEERLARVASTGEARIMACGPIPMLRAVREVARRRGVSCYLSLEAEMACGLGACLGCAVERRQQKDIDVPPGSNPDYVHVCADGPVFDAEEIWP
jgi:dihydroorotate dehydrogenase electron transfer subunit